MTGWKVRWNQSHQPWAPSLESTVYATQDAALEWAQLVRRQGAIDIRLIEVNETAYEVDWRTLGAPFGDPDKPPDPLGRAKESTLGTAINVNPAAPGSLVEPIPPRLGTETDDPFTTIKKGAGPG